ncbi:MAG: L,D-transpeptidase [Planctomycetota bacterium]
MVISQRSCSNTHTWLVAASIVLCHHVALSFAGEPHEAMRRTLAWQIALENEGFSPGIIDGRTGRKTETATREFQRARGLAVTGALDSATAATLQVKPELAVILYCVRPDDVTDIGELPTDWLDKSKKKRLSYESAEAALAEKFHCSRALLTQLNPGRNFSLIKAGDVLQVPRMADTPTTRRGQTVEIDLGEKTIRVMSPQGNVVGLFHCSVAAKKSHLPSGTAHVEVITPNPTYLFDPKMWPEVKGIDRKLLIPPGPRNPVGLCWIGLSLPGYGIHGTPQPEMIGKTGSHGCIRLTNWDAIRLARMIAPGTSIRFISNGGVATSKR